MVQRKAIFIGRVDSDAGLDVYRLLAKKFDIKLDEYTNTPNAVRFLPNYNHAFVSRYLAILEALAVGVPVIAHYNNKIKYDYLAMAPFVKFIKLFSHASEVNSLDFDKKLIIQGQKWARAQTWSKLASQYEEIWKI